MLFGCFDAGSDDREAPERGRVDWLAIGVAVAVMVGAWQLPNRTGLWNYVPVLSSLLAFNAVHWLRTRVKRDNRAT